MSPAPNEYRPPQQKPEEHNGDNKLGVSPAVIVGLMIAASAGFTMYTKRVPQMLKSMEKVTERQHIRNPPKAGPLTKEEWEKLRPRWEKDDI